MNKENLLKMADYIETIPQELFSMYIWRMDLEECIISWDDILKDKIECNTIGCALGWCGNIFSEELYSSSDYKSFSKKITNIDSCSGLWKWLFDSNWYKVDNTSTGAAKRICWTLENGLPDNWENQINGIDELCY